MEALLRVLVGPDHREFVVHRSLLCASSAFFRDSLDAVPPALTPNLSSSSSSSPSPASVLWLADESADVFELFVLWLYRRHAFRAVVEDAVTILAGEAEPDEVLQLLPESPSTSPPLSESLLTSASRNLSDLHWHLVRLHLFAVVVDIPVLQDAVTDALQDLYLRFDWPATPALLQFLYLEADPIAACRLRKWAVALLAWTMAAQPRTDSVDLSESSESCGSSNSSSWSSLRRLAALPGLHADYAAHRRKMQASRANVRIKNPQLRIPSNQLRREDRHFGFRQCSFHSHRRTVGEGRCPHEQARREHQNKDHTGQTVQTDQSQKHIILTSVDTQRPPFVAMHSPASSLSSNASSEPRRVDLPVWSPLSITTPGYAPLGMESTI
ncbi:hypothetical protein SCUCBS95973_008562 [Sporothrix curviconia]|uniref:BTB domain-containing protein n=1 Tax=Sporothrix curviconia TaxID=1260050 RepID=A0ABP0CP32_9PEZI